MCLKQIIFFLIGFFLYGCGSTQSTSQKSKKHYGPIIDSSALGIIFTAVDPHYRFSTVYWYNLKSGEIRQELVGQSGDPFLYADSLGIYLFNRSKHLQNMSSLSFDSSLYLRQGKEVAFKGNPVAGERLSNGHLLVALYDEGSIVEIDTSNLFQIIRSYKFSELEPFRPSAMYKIQKNNSEYIFVIHRGLDLNHQANHSQKLLIFEYQNESGLKLVGQPIPIQATSASFINATNDWIDIVGICTKWLTDRGCQAGIDRLFFKDFSIESLNNFSNWPYESSGQVVEGFASGHFFADVMAKTSGDRFIALIDYAKPQSLETSIFHSIGHEFGAFMLLAEPNSKTLFFGTTENGTDGILTILGQNSTKTVALEGIPYNGQIIRR